MKTKIFNLSQLTEVEICDENNFMKKAYVNLYFTDRGFCKTFETYSDASEWGCEFMYHKFKFMIVHEDGEKISINYI